LILLCLPLPIFRKVINPSPAVPSEKNEKNLLLTPVTSFFRCFQQQSPVYIEALLTHPLALSLGKVPKCDSAGVGLKQTQTESAHADAPRDSLCCLGIGWNARNLPEPGLELSTGKVSRVNRPAAHDERFLPCCIAVL
jgi:hypothetical protein